MKFYDAFVDQALRNPGKLFSGPWEVVQNPWLQPQDKRRILESWEDQSDMMRTEDENVAKSVKNKVPVEILYQNIKQAEEQL